MMDVYHEDFRDSIALDVRIKAISVSSLATASGNDQMVAGRYNGDPYCAPKCSSCGTEWPQTRVEGIGPSSIRCVKCGAEATPFVFTNGYTIVFDQAKSVGVTIGKAAAEDIARDAARYAALPEGSVQNPILLFAPSDLVGLSSRLRPFLGQLGTTPFAMTTEEFGFPGATPVVSANGTQSGIVWAVETFHNGTGGHPASGPAVLHAYDATNLATEFWNSSQNAVDNAGNAVKFTVPVVANGRVYIGTRGNDTGAGGTSVPGELDVYGLKPN